MKNSNSFFNKKIKFSKETILPLSSRIEELSKIFTDRPKNTLDVRWIPGHKKIYGNMIANNLAKKHKQIDTFEIYFNMIDRMYNIIMTD